VIILRAARALLPYLLALISIAGWANFFWYIGENLQFDGSALGGVVRDGHYYLAQHGTYTEVSQAVWEHIRVHEMSLWLSMPGVFACFIFLLMGYVFPWVVGLRQGEIVAERVRDAQVPRMPLAAGWCIGNIGGVAYGFPSIGVQVFSEGITIRLFPRQPVAILKAELNRVERPKSRARWTEITHHSPDIVSPVKLYISPQSELAGALDRLAARADATPTESPERSSR
jgi:hypothetical protein